MSALPSTLAIEITYVVTEDGADGQPWLPDSMDFWAVVARSHGFTRWRHIGLQQKQSITVALGGGLAKSGSAGNQRRNLKQMDMRKYSGSSFLKVDDLKDRPPLQARIAVVEIGKYDRPDITFESGKKLSVNATNNETLCDSYGWDSEAWVGHVIELSVVDGQFKGEPIKLIKVRPISKPEHYGEAQQVEPGQRKPEPPPAPKSLSDNMDDEIPF